MSKHATFSRTKTCEVGLFGWVNTLHFHALKLEISLFDRVNTLHFHALKLEVGLFDWVNTLHFQNTNIYLNKKYKTPQRKKEVNLT